MRVAIVGMGPSAYSYVRHCGASGGRHVEFDQVWTVNNYGDILAADLIFHMDDVRVQQLRADAGNVQMANMLKWMKTSKVPIITSRAHPDYPNMRAFPFEKVVNEVCGGMVYFDTTPSYMVPYAIWKGAKSISCFGLDYDYHPEFNGEKGRACVEYWLGVAYEKGIDVITPHDTWLLNSRDRRPYGYDTLTIKGQQQKNGKYKFSFEPHDPPTAAEIEKRYDHTVKRKSNGSQRSHSQLQNGHS